MRLEKTMEEGKPYVSTSAYIIDSSQKKIPISVSTSLLIDRNGEVLGGVEIFRDHSLVEELRRQLTASFHVEDIVSNSNAMKKIFHVLPQISQSDATVLIEGETGTGKELMARAIHNMGPRKDCPFVAINCGALPDTLLESELFGYKKGRSPMRSRTSPASSPWPGAARCFWMKSETPARRFRSACSGCFRSMSTPRWAVWKKSRPMYGLSRPPTGTCRN